MKGQLNKVVFFGGLLGMMFLVGFFTRTVPSVGRAQEKQAEKPTNSPSKKRTSAGGTKVAAVNLYILFRDSRRIKNFKEDMRKLTDPHDKKIDAFRSQYEGWSKVYKEEIDANKKNEARKRALSYKRLLEDEVTVVNALLKKESDKHVITLYREIEDTVARFAKTHDIDLVFYHFEPMEPEKKYTASNIHRIFASASPNVRASSPVFIAPHADISAPVLKLLNQAYRKTRQTNEDADATVLTTPRSPLREALANQEKP